MTAYLTLKQYPLTGDQDGFTTTVTEAQAQADAQGQSFVAVRAGEQLTERDRRRPAARFPAGDTPFRQIVLMPSVTLPVVGTLTIAGIPGPPLRGPDPHFGQPLCQSNHDPQEDT